MTKSISSFIVISLIVGVVSFAVSLQSNVLADAVIRSLIVSIVTFVILFAAFYIISLLTKESSLETEETGNADNQDTDHQDHVLQAGSQDDESFKGGHINLQTPDEDHFVPLKPQELSKHED